MLKAAHLLPSFTCVFLPLSSVSHHVRPRVKQVLNAGTSNAEFVVGVLIGGMVEMVKERDNCFHLSSRFQEMAQGRGRSSHTARVAAASAALRNPALVSLLPGALCVYAQVLSRDHSLRLPASARAKVAAHLSSAGHTHLGRGLINALQLPDASVQLQGLRPGLQPVPGLPAPSSNQLLASVSVPAPTRALQSDPPPLQLDK